MKKTVLVGLAILAVSTSGALAAKKTTKPKAAAAATTTNTGGAAPVMLGQVSASDRALYEKSQRESGMKKQRDKLLQRALDGKVSEAASVGGLFHSRTSDSKATPSGSFSSNHVAAASAFAKTLRC
jgi:hypothetical protein